MSYSDKDKAKALAIVHIFETGKALGDYSAVAVLKDGAGISYGINQFTHRSGSLAAVIRRYAKLAGEINVLIASALPDFASGSNIAARSADKALKQALAAAGKDPLMQQAQREIAFENYLSPALIACEGSNFVYPLSLAVIYDSMNQGGYTTVRDRTVVDMPGNGSIKPEEYEQEWIKTYCIMRRKWLISRRNDANKTAYRPDFFLAEIKKGNWDLTLPLVVNGHRITQSMLFPSGSSAVDTSTSAGSANPPADPGTIGQTDSNPPAGEIPPPNTTTVELAAPAKEGATAASAKMTIGGIVIPGFIVTAITTIKQWVADGYIDAKQIADTVLQFIQANQKYVFVLITALIGLLIVKKVIKQVTFWLSMLTHAIPTWNNVVVAPAEQPAAKDPLSITATALEKK